MISATDINSCFPAMFALSEAPRKPVCIRKPIQSFDGQKYCRVYLLENDQDAPGGSITLFCPTN